MLPSPHIENSSGSGGQQCRPPLTCSCAFQSIAGPPVTCRCEEHQLCPPYLPLCSADVPACQRVQAEHWPAAPKGQATVPPADAVRRQGATVKHRSTRHDTVHIHMADETNEGYLRASHCTLHGSIPLLCSTLESLYDASGGSSSAALHRHLALHHSRIHPHVQHPPAIEQVAPYLC